MRADFARLRVKQVMDRVGQDVVVRQMTSSGGATPLLSPATIVALVLDGAHALGATTVNLKATSISGYLRAGDMLYIGNAVKPVLIQADADPSNSHVTVSVSPGLVRAYDDLTPVRIAFIGDVAVKARVANFATNLVDGSLVQQTDIQVIIPALSLPKAPTQQDKIIFDGKTRSIVNVLRNYTRDAAAYYSVQAR